MEILTPEEESAVERRFAARMEAITQLDLENRGQLAGVMRGVAPMRRPRQEVLVEVPMATGKSTLRELLRHWFVSKR